MTASNELQEMIFERLVADAGVHGICADRIYDAPSKDAPFPYVSFGPSDVIEDDAECITGRTETIQLDCWSRTAGKFKEVKSLADAVKKALHEYDGTLIVNALVQMRVIGIRFFKDPDNITTHGVVTVEAMIEEN